MGKKMKKLTAKVMVAMVFMLVRGPSSVTVADASSWL